MRRGDVDPRPHVQPTLEQYRIAQIAFNITTSELNKDLCDDALTELNK